MKLILFWALWNCQWFLAWNGFQSNIIISKRYFQLLVYIQSEHHIFIVRKLECNNKSKSYFIALTGSFCAKKRIKVENANIRANSHPHFCQNALSSKQARQCNDKREYFCFDFKYLIFYIWLTMISFLSGENGVESAHIINVLLCPSLDVS